MVIDKTQVEKEWHGIQVNVSNNNNKFYGIYLYKNGEVYSHYGRVGEPGKVTDKPIGYGASDYHKKISDKQRGKPSKGEVGYVESKTIDVEGGNTTTKTIQQSNLAEVAASQITAKSPVAIELIKKLAQANVHQILESTTLKYNAHTGMFSTPLGIVTQDALNEARAVLIRIGDYVARSDWSNRSFNLDNNHFFQLVPQDLGRSRQSVQDLWPGMDKIRERNNLLDDLEASVKMALTPQPDSKEKTPEVKRIFEASMDLIEDKDEFRRLDRKYRETLNRGHACAGLKLNRAFSVSIDSMDKNFRDKGLPLGNVQELWHGTGTGNLISILKTGFKMSPPSTARIAGKMFGNGLYFALQSTKSLNYAYGYWSGTRNRTCYMFLNDVAMGNWKIPSGPTSSTPPSGYHTWWAKPGKSGISNDEIVVFKEYQVNPRYLLEFTE